MCICTYVVHMSALCACAFWEYTFSLATDWTWKGGAGAANDSLGLLDISFLKKLFLKYYWMVKINVQLHY